MPICRLVCFSCLLFFFLRMRGMWPPTSTASRGPNARIWISITRTAPASRSTRRSRPSPTNSRLPSIRLAPTSRCRMRKRTSRRVFVRIDTPQSVANHTSKVGSMAKRFYPAVLERGHKGSFAIWFPDFPDCVAGGTTQKDAKAKTELALAKAVDALAEGDRPLPQPTTFEEISVPKGSKPIAYFAVSVEPPNPSERVNIYLPKNLFVLVVF